jgi:hypothetical protein
VPRPSQRPGPAALAGSFTGRWAELVTFYTQPRLLLAALQGGALPPLSSETTLVLFGPGLYKFSRLASTEDVALWKGIQDRPLVSTLIDEGHPRETIEDFLNAGIAEFAD